MGHVAYRLMLEDDGRMILLGHADPSPPTPAEVAEILDDAATLIDTEGWCQGRPRADGAHCVVAATTVAAIMHAARHGVAGRSIYANAALMRHLGLRRPEQLPDWNDARERTAGEVTAALRGCAARLRDVGRVPTPA